MQPIEAAILRTLLYADIFSFAMTPEEIYRHLIHSEPIPLENIQKTLANSSQLNDLLIQEAGFFTVANRPENITHRLEREKFVQAMWDDALHYGHWLAQIPFVRMVAMTGALAVRNPFNEQDDYDYLLVTQPKRVWLARAIAIILVRIVRLRKRELCPNYVLAVDQLEQKRQDLFMAREVAQMFPIYGGNIYTTMLSENDWVHNFLANVTPYPLPEDKPSRFKMLLEKLLGGWFGDKLEAWEYQRKRRKFEAETHKPDSSAVIDSGHVKGHFNDNGHPVMRKYHARLQEYGLLKDDVFQLAGD